MRVFFLPLLCFRAEDIRNGYPFDLCCVKLSFEWCSKCAWPAFCRGCAILTNDEIIEDNLVAVAIDWKPIALYLRYQHSVELVRILISATEKTEVLIYACYHCKMILAFILLRIINLIRGIYFSKFYLLFSIVVSSFLF